MYRAQLTALDTLQHRLARDAQGFHRRPHGEPSAWRLLQEAGPQLVGEPDLPRSAGCELLAANEAIGAAWTAPRPAGEQLRSPLPFLHPVARSEVGNAECASADASWRPIAQ